MVQYPSYSQMNNPYAPMNSMYTQPNNPYVGRMNFSQGYQQNLQQNLQQAMPPAQMPVAPNFQGKIVDSIEAVKATDIPMDGNVYYFPKADGSEIFGKQWQPNGTTCILTYKPVLDEEPNTLSNNTEKSKFALSESATEGIMKRFDDLEKQINDLMTKPMTKTMTSRAKKESETE